MKQLLSEITRIRTIMNYSGLIKEDVGGDLAAKIIVAGEKTFDDAAKRAIRTASREIANDVDDMLRTVADDAIEAETKLNKINYVYGKLLGNPSLANYATKFVDEIALQVPELVKRDINLAKSTTKNAIEDAIKSGSKVDIAATKAEFKNALKSSLSYSDDVPLSFIDDFIEKETKFIDDLESTVKKSSDFDQVIKTRVENALSKKIPPQKIDQKLYDQMTEYGSDLYKAYLDGTKSMDDIVDELAKKCGMTKTSFWEQVKKFASPLLDAFGSVTDWMAITVKKGGKRTVKGKNLIYWMLGTLVGIVGINAAGLIPGSSKVLPGFMTSAKREFLDNYPWAKCFDDKGKFGGLTDFEYWDKLGTVTFGTESPSCEMVSDEFKNTNPSKFVSTLNYIQAEGDSDPKLIWTFGDGSQWTTYLPSGNTTKTKEASVQGGTTITPGSKGTEASFKAYLKSIGFTDSDINNTAFNFTANENAQVFSFAGVAYTYDSSTNSFK